MILSNAGNVVGEHNSCEDESRGVFRNLGTIISPSMTAFSTSAVLSTTRLRGTIAGGVVHLTTVTTYILLFFVPLHQTEHPPGPSNYCIVRSNLHLRLRAEWLQTILDWT